jgi:hypothetical protein
MREVCFECKMEGCKRNEEKGFRKNYVASTETRFIQIVVSYHLSAARKRLEPLALATVTLILSIVVLLAVGSGKMAKFRHAWLFERDCHP